MSDEQIITQDEMDALLSGVTEGDVQAETGVPAPKGEVVEYDFVHPRHQLESSLPVLDVINEKMAKQLGPALSLVIHKPMTVTVSGVETLRYSDYSSALTQGMSLNRIRLNPLPGSAMLNIDANIVLIMVDYFFGGAGKIPEGPMMRDYTGTELRIIDRVLEVCYRAISDAWSEVYGLSPEFMRRESSLRATNPANPDDVLVTCKFNIETEAGNGEFHLAMPYSMLEPIRPLLVSSIERHPKDDGEWARAFSERVLDANIDLQGVFARSEISLGELLNLNDGDLIPVGQSRTAEFYAEKLPLFTAQIGVSNGKVSAKVMPS